MSTNPEKVEIRGSLLTTKYALENEVYILYNDKIHRAIIESITKTVVSKTNNAKRFCEEEETYGLRLIKNDMRLTRTNNVGNLFKTAEEVLNNIEILE